MDIAEAEKQVIALAADILGVPVTPSSSMDNTPGWDSLRQMQLIFAFEETFNLRLDGGELLHLRSVSALAQRLARPR